MMEQISKSVRRLGTLTLASYLIRSGGEAMLFEVGISGTARLVLSQLDALGVPREEITRVIVSHAHSDHAAGQAVLLAGLPRARLLLTGKSSRHLAKDSTAQLYIEEDVYTQTRQMARGEAVSGEPASLPLLPQPWELVSAGERLKVGGVTVELKHARGHVPGGLTAWLPKEGVLLASDSAGFSCQGRPHFPLYFVSYTDYMAALEGFREISPQVVGLGHQDVFRGDDAVKYLAKQVDHLEQEHRRILAALAGGQDDKHIAHQLFDRYYNQDLTIYPPQSILHCCRLLVRRSKQAGL